MKYEYNVMYSSDLNFKNFNEHTVILEEVGECPCCHRSITPTYINGIMIANKENQIPLTAFIVLYCSACKEIFTAKYTSNGGTANLKLDFTFPKSYTYKEFPKRISNLSSNFVSIYSQAAIAESQESIQGVAGLAYRKSIEFLIKDYLMKIKNRDYETTMKMDLSDCVNQLDKTLIALGKASTWIGNDETHYFRKNPEYNIENLKDFISALVSKIDTLIVEKEAENLVSKK